MGMSMYDAIGVDTGDAIYVLHRVGVPFTWYVDAVL
jgi:hypothetical protein